VYKWRAIYCWKTLDEGYNFALDFISIGGLHTKLWGPKVPKVVGVPTLGISGNGSPGTKCHLDVGLVKRHKVYYKGEGGGFFQVQAVMNFVNLVSLSLPVDRPSTQKCSNYALTNLLFGLCKSMWMIKCLSFILVSFWSFSTSLYPKVLRAREHAPTLYFFVVFTSDSPLKLSRSLGSHQWFTFWITMPILQSVFSLDTYNK
jgi:hypothetical protein